MIKQYLQALQSQNAEQILYCFAENARIVWPNTSESFTALQFAQINHAYPGQWNCALLHSMQEGNKTIALYKIFNQDVELYATSIFTLQNDKILYLEEYFAENTAPPVWRGTEFQK